jgi:hypothetical protein
MLGACRNAGLHDLPQLLQHALVEALVCPALLEAGVHHRLRPQ